MSSSFRTSTFVKRGLQVAELVALALIAYLFVKVVLAVTAPQSLWQGRSSASAPLPAVNVSAQQTFNFSQDPFHREAALVPVDLGRDAPETTLNLKLTGLRAGGDGAAFLQTPDNLQGVYHIGDEIISGVTLQAVSSRYIVLSLNGRLERLTFERDQANTLIAAKENASPQNVLGLSPSAAPADFLSMVKLTRVSEKGVTGFQIGPKPGGLNLSSFGLKDGDIITRVAEQDLSQGLPDMASLANSLSGANSVNITVLRDGREISLEVGSQ